VLADDEDLRAPEVVDDRGRLRRGGDRLQRGGAVGRAVDVLERPAAARKRVRGEVHAAERVESQPPAGALLGERPHHERHVESLGDRGQHRGIGERDLDDEQEVDPLGGEPGERGERGVRIVVDARLAH
jgi:hypothetical protein